MDYSQRQWDRAKRMHDYLKTKGCIADMNTLTTRDCAIQTPIGQYGILIGKDETSFMQQYLDDFAKEHGTQALYKPGTKAKYNAFDTIAEKISPRSQSYAVNYDKLSDEALQGYRDAILGDAKPVYDAAKANGKPMEVEDLVINYTTSYKAQENGIITINNEKYMIVEKQNLDTFQNCVKSEIQTQTQNKSDVIDYKDEGIDYDFYYFDDGDDLSGEGRRIYNKYVQQTRYTPMIKEGIINENHDVNIDRVQSDMIQPIPNSENVAISMSKIKSITVGDGNLTDYYDMYGYGDDDLLYDSKTDSYHFYYGLDKRLIENIANSYQTAIEKQSETKKELPKQPTVQQETVQPKIETPTSNEKQQVTIENVTIGRIETKNGPAMVANIPYDDAKNGKATTFIHSYDSKDNSKLKDVTVKTNSKNEATVWYKDDKGENVYKRIPASELTEHVERQRAINASKINETQAKGSQITEPETQNSKQMN